MKWLTLQKIKKQCRIDDINTSEDDLLEMYGESAEATVLNLLSRSYEDVMESYGAVPKPIIHASLMLCDISYQHRSAVSPQSMSIVPYTIDLLLKPYMRLADYNPNVNVNNNHYGCKNL